MRLFLAQRITGENINKLREESTRIIDILKEKGHGCYCTLLEGESFEKKSKKDIMNHAFKEIDNSDALLVILRSNDKSEGLLMEIGYSLNKKKIILAINQNVKETYLKDIADSVIEFEDIEELYTKLKELKI